MDVLGKRAKGLGSGPTPQYGLDASPPFLERTRLSIPTLSSRIASDLEKNKAFFPSLATLLSCSSLHMACSPRASASASASASRLAPRSIPRTALLNSPGFISFNFPPSTRISFYVTTRRKTLRSIDASCYREGRNFPFLFGTICNICMMSFFIPPLP